MPFRMFQCLQHLIRTIEVPKHDVVESEPEELADARKLLLRRLDQGFVPNLQIPTGLETTPGASPTSDAPRPFEGRSFETVGTEPQAQNRKCHVPPVTNDMNETCLGEHVGQRGDALHVARGLVSISRLALPLRGQAEDT